VLLAQSDLPHGHLMDVEHLPLWSRD
jgi:hypothetical protein